MYKKCSLYINGKASIDKIKNHLVLFLALPYKLLYQPRIDFILPGFLYNRVVPFLISVSKENSSVALKIVSLSFKH